jgi:hypothetical protein
MLNKHLYIKNKIILFVIVSYRLNYRSHKAKNVYL